MGLLSWILVGLVAGALARLLMPGKQPMGCLMTTILGMVGSLVGGFLWTTISGRRPVEPGLQVAGLFWSTIGAFVTLAVVLWIARSRDRA